MSEAKGDDMSDDNEIELLKEKIRTLELQVNGINILLDTVVKKIFPN